jgi:hypothetical protein
VSRRPLTEGVKRAARSNIVAPATEIEAARLRAGGNLSAWTRALWQAPDAIPTSILRPLAAGYIVRAQGDCTWVPSRGEVLASVPEEERAGVAALLDAVGYEGPPPIDDRDAPVFTSDE